jgi:hypothetical protein
MSKPQIDNTPYWAIDPYRWDISFLQFHGRGAKMEFDVTKEATVQHLLSAIKQRGSKIYIGFSYYDAAKDRYIPCDVVQIAQFGKNICHSCVWFGEHVTTLAAGDRIMMVESPLNYGRWELISLPFTDVPLAFRIAVDITIKCNSKGINYSDHRMSVFSHMMARLFIPGHSEDRGIKGDYDADKPETWRSGVQCSQLTLLFLKRCVIRNALYIPPQHREMFLQTYSFTCLPASLRDLVSGIWGVTGEFRDYGNVGNDVRKRWYPHYYDRKDTKLLK